MGQEVIPSLGGPLSSLLDPGFHLTKAFKGLPGGSAVRNPPAVQEPQEVWVPSLVRKILWRRAWQPTPVSLPGEAIDGGAWQATVRGVAKSQTLLK